MHFGLNLLAAGVSYLLGSISFARVIAYLWTSGKDITEHEISLDGADESYQVLSIGANSVSSLLGRRAAMLVSLLDVLKVFLPTLYFKLNFPDQPGLVFVAAAAGFIGHVWPIYYRFHGGSGFTAIMGGLLVIDWLALLVTPIAGLVLGMVVVRNMVAASLSWMWLLVPWLWWRSGGDPAHILYASGINILFLLAMIPEYRMAMKYKAQGKYLEYGMGNLKSNPMGRGMIKIANFFRVEIK